MIILTTGTPTASIQGDKVAVSIPSGSGSVIIAMEPQQAKVLCHAVMRAAKDAIDARLQASVEAVNSGNVIAFPARSCA